MTYQPPAGMIGHAVASLFNGDPKRQMDDDLMRMKAFIETGITPRKAQRIDLAANSGKTSGPTPGTPGTVAIRDTADTKDRISADVDADGYRTAVTLDAS